MIQALIVRIESMSNEFELLEQFTVMSLGPSLFRRLWHKRFLTRSCQFQEKSFCKEPQSEVHKQSSIEI